MLVIAVLAVGWLLATVFAVLALRLTLDRGRLLLQIDFLEQRVAQVGAAEKTHEFGLTVGTSAPDFELPDLEGRSHALSSWRGNAVILLFFDPDCSFCKEMAPALLDTIRNRRASDPLPVIVSTRGIEKNRELLAGRNVDCPILLQDGAEVAALFDALATPSAHRVDAAGIIDSELALGSEAVLALLGATSPDVSVGETATQVERSTARVSGNIRSLAESRLNRSGLTIGTPAPSFSLPRVDGGELSLSEYVGQQVLLVFSDPECVPCNELAPKLQVLHQRASRPQVLMVSRGTVDANCAKVEEFGLTFPIVLQRHWEISRAYGMFATPIAYRIDERGVIDSDVAVGTDAILQLESDSGERRSARKEVAALI